MSPQTPLTILFHPLLSGGYSKAISLDSCLLTGLQWVFCVFTCNHPPQQTLHPVASLLPSSQAFREEGPISRCIRWLRSDTRPDPTEFQPRYTDFSFISRYMVWYASLPLPTKLNSRGSWTAVGRTEGVILLFVAYLRLHLQSSASTNSPPCHFVTSLLSSLSRGVAILSIYTGFSFISRYMVWYASLPLPTKLNSRGSWRAKPV